MTDRPVTRPGGLRLRPAEAADAEAIEAVRVAGWQSAYRGIIDDGFLNTMAPAVRRRRAQLRDPAAAIQYVAEAGGMLAGWAAAGPARDEDLAPLGYQEVYACYVCPAHWRGGIGRRLLSHVLDLLDPEQPVSLWVLKGNARAVRFYATFDFRPDGTEQLLDRERLAADVWEVRLLRDQRSGT